MTAFLQCFWMFSQIGAASKWNHASSFGKVSQPLCTVCLWACLSFFYLRYTEPDFQILHIPDPTKCVFGPGDVWACPIIYWIVLRSENVGQTISDPGHKLIVYTLPSIWQYPFFQKDKKNVCCQNRQIQQIWFFLYRIAYCIAYSFRLESLGPIHSAWNH